VPIKISRVFHFPPCINLHSFNLTAVKQNFGLSGLLRNACLFLTNERNGLGTSASDPVSALTPASLQSSFTFVPYTSENGHGDHAIQASARPSDLTALNGFSIIPTWLLDSIKPP
jgi:hypothetical protein